VTKSQLIEKIATKNPNLTLKEIDRIVSVIFDSIIDALIKNERVEFRGFGAFSVRNRAPRIAKNPRTGEKLRIGSRNIPHFKAGKQLCELLNKK
jgi:integration host factor subunit beta